MTLAIYKRLINVEQTFLNNHPTASAYILSLLCRFFPSSASQISSHSNLKQTKGSYKSNFKPLYFWRLRNHLGFKEYHRWSRSTPVQGNPWFFSVLSFSWKLTARCPQWSLFRFLKSGTLQQSCLLVCFSKRLLENSHKNIRALIG